MYSYDTVLVDNTHTTFAALQRQFSLLIV